MHLSVPVGAALRSAQHITSSGDVWPHNTQNPVIDSRQGPMAAREQAGLAERGPPRSRRLVSRHVVGVALVFGCIIVAAGGSAASEPTTAGHSGQPTARRQSTARAVVPFTLAGQEIMRVFHAPSRLFTFQDHPRNLLRGQVLRVEQGYQKDGAGLGSVVWDGSFVMAHWLQRRGCALRVEGRRVLELGAGTGIASVAAARLGASLVVATDGDAAVLPLLARNLGNNTDAEVATVLPLDGQRGSQGQRAAADTTPAPRSGVEVRRLVWGRTHPDLAQLRQDHPEPFDVILGADVVFEHDSAKTAARNISLIHAANTTFTGLVETLQELAPRGSATKVLISHKRRYNREHAFHDMMASHFERKRIPARQLHRDFRGSNLWLYVFTARPALERAPAGSNSDASDITRA